MIIKSAARLAFAAVCLTAIATSYALHAQMGYWPPPGLYSPHPAPMAMASHKAPTAPRLALMAFRGAPMARGAGMCRRRLEPR